MPVRHGPMGSDKLYPDRVAYLEDRAQTDPEHEPGVSTASSRMPCITALRTRPGLVIGGIRRRVRRCPEASGGAPGTRLAVGQQRPSRQVEIPISEVVAFSNNSIERRYEIVSLYARQRAQEASES